MKSESADQALPQPAQQQAPRPGPLLAGLVSVGLVLRALREVFWTTLIFASVLGSIAYLLSIALPRIQARFMSRGFVPPGVQQFRDAMMGMDTRGAGVAEVAFSLAWSHPIVIALLAAHAIVVCTRVLAGEVERGTVDVLLALPVSRTRLLMSETLAWIISACILFGGLLGGTYLGTLRIDEAMRPDWSRLLMALPNLVLVYACIGLLALLASMMSDRKIRAVLTAVIALVFSVVINFLYTLDASLEFTKNFAFLSLLHYYKPLRVMLTGEWPTRDLLTLAGVSLAMWVAALVVLRRRDIATT
jgi:ABC-type transport system involved in multi-copper enzyme maturation permease subunit